MFPCQIGTVIGTVPGKIKNTILGEYEPDVTSLRCIVMLDDKSVLLLQNPALKWSLGIEFEFSITKYSKTTHQNIRKSPNNNCVGRTPLL